MWEEGWRFSSGGPSSWIAELFQGPCLECRAVVKSWTSELLLSGSAPALLATAPESCRNGLFFDLNPGAPLFCELQHLSDRRLTGLSELPLLKFGLG